MVKIKLSIGYKIIAYISIVAGAWMTLATILMSLIRFSEIPIGSTIITLIACISLLVAGIGALKSIRTGFYLYLSSCIIWLLRYIPALIFRLGFFRQLSPSLSGLIAVIFGIAGFPFSISLLGLIISHFELKKTKERK